jgi:hypothetical protein
MSPQPPVPRVASRGCRSQWEDLPSGEVAEVRHCLVGPHSADAQFGDRVRKPRLPHHLHCPLLTHAQHLGQLGQGDDRWRRTHHRTLRSYTQRTFYSGQGVKCVPPIGKDASCDGLTKSLRRGDRTAQPWPAAIRRGVTAAISASRTFTAPAPRTSPTDAVALSAEQRTELPNNIGRRPRDSAVGNRTSTPSRRVYTCCCCANTDWASTESPNCPAYLEGLFDDC